MFSHASALTCWQHLKVLVNINALTNTQGAEGQMRQFRKINDALLLLVQHPFTVLHDCHHQKLRTFLEIHNEELICLVCGHFTLLRLEIAAKNKASTGCPNIGTP